MAQNPNLSYSKVRFNANESTGQNSVPGGSSLRKRVLAKVVQPLRSRSRSFLNSSASFSRDLSTVSEERSSNSFSRPSCSSIAQESHNCCVDIAASETSLNPPSNATALLWPHISIIPELDTLEHGSSQELWVLVKVSGEVKLSEIPSKSLDIVAILDCSSHSSPACLEEACKCLVQISHHLDSIDRLAIIASSQRHVSTDSSSTAGCILRSLREPDPGSIERELRRAIHNRGEASPLELDLGENLVAAFRILGHSVGPLNGTLQWPGGSGLRNATQRGTLSTARDASPLVIILSPNHSEFCDIVADMAPVPVCVVQPSALPWHSASETSIEWKLCAFDLHGIFPLNQEPIQSLLDHARTATDLAGVRDINILAEPAEGCIIKEIIGPCKHELLHPGEIVSLAVCVAVPALPDSSSRVEDTREPGNLFKNNESLILELESFLGIATQDILSVEVSFTCSMPSGQPTSFVEQESWALRRYDSLSQWLDPSEEAILTTHQPDKINVLGAVMMLAAQGVDIQEAQGALEEVYSRFRHHPELNIWKEQLETEIEYQINLVQRYRLQQSPREQRKPSFNLDMQGSSDFAHCVPDLEPTRGKEHLVSSKSRSTSYHSDHSFSSGTTTIHHDMDEDSEKEEKLREDEARKIWKIIRRDSKSKKQARRGTGVMLEGSRASDHTMEILRRRAIQSKRSIGADTLRSLSFDVDAANRGHQAPWL